MYEKTIKIVVLYTRVSTVEQTDGFSLDNQLDQLKDNCKINGYNIVGIYTDAGASGSSIDERYKYQEMIEYISEHSEKVDAVMAWTLSRVGRSLNDLTSLMTYLDELDIVLITLRDSVNTGTSTGRFMAEILGSVNQMERHTILANTKDGMQKRAKDGLWGGGIVLGYDSADKKLIINEDEAERVRTIFELYVYEDYGYNRIVKHLNTRGIKTKKGNTWAHSTVKSVLDNPLYAGYIRYGVRKDWNKERKNNNNPNYTLVKSDHHQPIISEELWQLTRDKRARVGKANPKVWKGEWLLSGLPKCPVCGASMVAHRVKRKSKEHPDGKMYRYYICSHYSNKDTSVCKPNLIDAKQTEEYAIEKLLEFVSNPNLIDVISEQARDKNKPNTDRYEKDIIKLNKRLKELKTTESLYYKHLGDPKKLAVLKEEKILAIIEDTNREMSYVNDELEEAHYRIKALEREDKTIESLTLALKHFKTLFEKATTEERKKLLHSLIKEIRIKQSDEFKTRTVEKIVLAFDEADVLEYLNSSAKKENLKTFVPTCDTVHRTIPNCGFF
ncbi:hypothetical protein F8154_11030 [Alkaliphilus pronyensis]|uniref:Recombinase family protein n=1 Tax=Alkaliphilus pronyensis TaxID=1482732 RepID=A0A6I0F7L8_9FIRM|nr:recombinase family protein [Alkaliphilus pronyensis]KAB3532926.1 hypothetical protein F8154_11030 [Alkaliphilus pronyensis]